MKFIKLFEDYSFIENVVKLLDLISDRIKVGQLSGDDPYFEVSIDDDIEFTNEYIAEMYEDGLFCELLVGMPDNNENEIDKIKDTVKTIFSKLKSKYKNSITEINDYIFGDYINNVYCDVATIEFKMK